MALQHVSALFPCLRRSSLVAMLVFAAAAGCSHNRSSYRPVYTSPASTPCASCGGSRSTVTTDEPVGAPTTTVPPLSGPSANSDVPTPSSSIQGGSGMSSSTPPEPPPSAKIGQEPEYDAIPLTPNKTKPPAGTGTSQSGQAPALQGPNAANTPATGRLERLDARRVSAAASQGDRRTLLGDRLQPFVAGSSARELFYPNKADRPWRYIVLHHSASATGNYDQIDREHRKILGYDGCGYHFVIGNGAGSADGQIEVAQRWDNQKQGVHCRNARSHEMDEYGIGICLVGDLDQQPPTPRQVAATQALVGYLSQRYRIEPGHVSTHSHFAATPTVCPGKYFPSQLINSSTKEAAHDADPRAAWNADRLLSMTR
jgi:hypothetical protein